MAVRIITGELKGREVFLPKNARYRPSTHFLREMLFSIIGPATVDGCVFLDVFAGSGVVGIEAISRGAAKSIFLEKSHRNASCIQQNLARLEVADRGVVMQLDAARELPKVGRELANGELIDLAFVDPPFKVPVEGPFLASLVRNSHLFAPDCRIYLETRVKPVGITDELAVVDQRNTSSSVLTTYRLQNTG